MSPCKLSRVNFMGQAQEKGTVLRREGGEVSVRCDLVLRGAEN